MLEKQGKDAHHSKSVLSVIYFFLKQVLVFVCMDAHTRTHTGTVCLSCFVQECSCVLR